MNGPDHLMMYLELLQIYLALSKQIGIGIRPKPFPRENRDGEETTPIILLILMTTIPVLLS